MKKIILLTMFLFCTYSFSQNKAIEYPQGTTEKEYKYLSIGYEQDYAAGKDIIDGYILEEVSTLKRTSVTLGDKKIIRNSILYKLIRKQTGKIAAFLLEQTREDNKVKVFICIPNAEATESIMTQASQNYYLKMNNKCEDFGGSYAYGWNILKILSQTLSN